MSIPKIWRKTLYFFRGIPKIALAVLLIIILVAIFADLLPIHDPLDGALEYRNQPPFWQPGGSFERPLGTDSMGRDVLSRLVFGTRISLIVAFLAVVVASILGTAIGILSGFLGGWVDHVLMRLTECWLCFPAIFIAILLSMLLGPGVQNIIIVLGVVFWTRYARVIRSEVLSLKEKDFVHLATTAGCSKMRIMFTHLLPNVINTSVVLSTLYLGLVVVWEATLSFIGVGVPPPNPAWGLMLADGRAGLMAGYWWQTVFPGLAIVLLVMSANMLGDWFRIRIDPQLQQLL